MEAWISDFKVFFVETMTKAMSESTDRLSEYINTSFESVVGSAASTGGIADESFKQEAEQQNISDVGGKEQDCQKPQEAVPEGLDQSLILVEYKCEQKKINLDFKSPPFEDLPVQNSQVPDERNNITDLLENDDNVKIENKIGSRENEGIQQTYLQCLRKELVRMDKDTRLNILTGTGIEIETIQMEVLDKLKDSILYEMSEDGSWKKAQLDGMKTFSEKQQGEELMQRLTFYIKK